VIVGQISKKVGIEHSAHHVKSVIVLVVLIQLMLELIVMPPLPAIGVRSVVVSDRVSVLPFPSVWP